MIGTKEFTLSDLLRKENLTLLRAVKDFTPIFDIILPKDAEGAIKRPLLVGVDGAVAAGKSTFASAMQAYLKQHGIDCVVIRGDWYMAAKDRWAAKKGAYPVGAYDQMACDFEEIADTQTRIDDFLFTGNERYNLTIPQVYNQETGEQDRTVNLDISRNSVIVFEGTGILSAELSEMFDLAIRVDMDGYHETLERLEAREAEKERQLRLPQVLVQERYDLIDRPYDQYLRSRDSEFFNFLIDTTETSAIKVYKRN